MTVSREHRIDPGRSRGIGRDVLLVAMGLLPCVAMLALAAMCLKTQGAAHNHASIAAATSASDRTADAGQPGRTLAAAHRAQFIWIYVFVGFTLACQVAVAVLCGYGIVMRRRLARTNALLSEQEADLTTTLRSLGDAVIATDMDGRIVRMNPAAESLTGWPRAEALGRPLESVFCLINAASREAIANPVLDALKRGEAVASVNDAIVVSRDASEHHVATNAAPIKRDDGRAYGAVLVFRDMTVEHQVRAKLLESEAMHREVIESLPAGVAIIDPVTRVIDSVNPYAAALFGDAADKIIGRRCHAFLCPAEENACPICDLNQTVDNSERVMLRANRSRVPILKSVKRIDVCGQEKLLECFVSISAHKQTEEDLRRAKQALEQHVVALRFANQALETSTHAVESNAQKRGELLAGMSHKIMTTMTSIVGFAERLLREPGLDRAPAQRVESLETIARNGRLLLGMIDNILDLSKFESGRLEIERTPCSPASIVAEAASRMQAAAAAKGLTLKVEYVGPIPALINTDPKRFRQILVNLVDNAVKFTETGEVRIVVELLDRASLRPRLACTVADTGVGMSPKQTASLFEPYGRRNGSANPEAGLAGLGLAISKMLAHRLDGDLSVQSELGRGSEFTVIISTGPLGQTQMIDDPDQLPCSVPERTPPAMAPDARLDCRILLAEDTPDIQHLIAALLTDRGARVEWVDNGEAAVEAAWAALNAGDPFDAILMDMQMPVLDGCGAVERLRLEGYEGRIIALTMRSMEEHRRKCLNAGCNDVLSKPIDPDRLMVAVSQSLVTS